MLSADQFIAQRIVCAVSTDYKKLDGLLNGFIYFFYVNLYIIWARVLLLPYSVRGGFM